MRQRKIITLLGLRIKFILTIGATLSIAFAPASIAGQSVTTFQVVNSTDGRQYYINREQRAVPLPGFGVKPGAGIVQVFRNAEGRRWYLAANGIQTAMPTKVHSVPVKEVAPAFAPLINGVAPLAEPVYWDDVGPYFWGPGHSLHRIDRNSEYFQQLQDWHNQGYWDYGPDGAVFSSSSNDNQSSVESGHPAWNKHSKKRVHAEQSK